jgi:type VI secretion system protein ImpK
MEEKAGLTGLAEPDAETDKALDSLLRQLTIAHATQLARSGQYAEAESILSASGEGSKTAPGALDLLARIRAQQGDLPEAEKLWEHANRLDPSNAAYLYALRRVAAMRENPAGRVTALRFATILSVVALICFGAWMFIKSRIGAPPDTSEYPANIQAAATPHKAGSTDTSNIPSPEPSPATDFEEAFNVQGVLTTRTAQGVQLEFVDGLFTRGTILNQDAYKRLRELSALLTPYRETIKVEIIGATDATPMARTSRYRDNIALGLERARVVYDYLRSTGGLNPQVLTIGSSAEQQKSYLNNLTADSFRNRTVILHLQKRR